MSAISVSEIEGADYQAVADLLNSAYEGIGTDLAETRHTVGARAQVAATFAAYVEGKPVATITASPALSPYSVVAQDREMELSRFAVHPKHQGQGVGKQLLLSVLKACAKSSHVDAVVGQSLDTMSAAHTIYRSIGAAIDPTREYITADGTPAHYYRLPLAGRH